MKHIVTPVQMQGADHYTIEQLGVPACVLMERAAMATVSHIPAQGTVLVLCGMGNNGGDGYAVARILHGRGRQAECFCFDVEKLRGDALLQHDIAERMGVPLHSDMSALAGLLAQADVIVDALFGTGLSRAPRWPYDEVIRMVNAAGRYIVAVDIPSGINGQTGHAEGEAVQATVTVTFQFAKIGCLLLPGRLYTGRLLVEDIGIPQDLAQNSRLLWVEDTDICPAQRTMAGNKTTYGHVGVLAGSTGMSGAGALCAQAALKSGAGLVSWAVPAPMQPVAALYAREVMTKALPDENGQFNAVAAEEAKEFLKGKTAVALGPGLGRAAAQAFVQAVAAYITCPSVWDADALFALAQQPQLLQSSTAARVLTPHAGELARLLGCTVQRIESEPVETAREAAQKYASVVVLKGASTVIAAPDGEVALSTGGSPGMATAGSGDVLCGTIAAFLAQGLPAFAAACAGCALHARAGELAENIYGMPGMAAGDILNELPAAFTAQRPQA